MSIDPNTSSKHESPVLHPRCCCRQVVVEGQKFAFHLVPCGVVYPHTQNVLGNGVVIHIPQMFKELAPLTDQGIQWEGRMKMSNRAHLLFQFHREIDAMMEARRGDSNIGTTKKGIGPCYSTKAFRNGIRVGMLKDMTSFEENYNTTVSQLEDWFGKMPYDTREELDMYKVSVPSNLIIAHMSIYGNNH